MVKADAEWAKLGQVPGLVDGWTDVKDKAGIATEEFKAGDFCSSARFTCHHTPLSICVSMCQQMSVNVNCVSSWPSARVECVSSC